MGKAPEPRWGHSACVVADKYMVVYGGWNGKTTLSDMFILDCGEYVWWEILLNSPIPRAYGRVLFRDEALYYVGGRTDTEVRQEVMKFDLSTLLAGGSDYYIFDVELFTIKDKAVDQSKSLLENYKFVRLLGYSPSEIVYLAEDVSFQEEKKADAEAEGEMTPVTPVTPQKDRKKTVEIIEDSPQNRRRKATEQEASPANLRKKTMEGAEGADGTPENNRKQTVDIEDLPQGRRRRAVEEPKVPEVKSVQIPTIEMDESSITRSRRRGHEETKTPDSKERRKATLDIDEISPGRRRRAGDSIKTLDKLDPKKSPEERGGNSKMQDYYVIRKLKKV